MSVKWNPMKNHIIFILYTHAICIYWVCGDCFNMRISYDDKTTMRFKNLSIHLLVLVFRKLVHIKFKVLAVFCIVKIKPKHINLKLMFIEHLIPVYHLFCIDRGPLAEMETKAISRRHLREPSNVS